MTYETPVGANMFAYCLNNPVMGTDPNGDVSVMLGLMLGGGIIGAAISAASSALTQYFTTGEVNTKSVIVAAGSGFIGGALAASPLKIKGQTVAGGILGFISYAVDCDVNEKSMTLGGVATAIVSGAFSGALGRDGANANMQLSNVIKNTCNTIARETRRANRSYAAKATASALAYRNNYVSNSAVSAYTRFWAGCTISNVASHVVDVIGG